MSEDTNMTLGELLAALREVKPQWSDYNDELEDKFVFFDFGTLVPTTFASWRGVYAEIALGYAVSQYDGDNVPPTVKKFIGEVEEVIGKTYEGWKGGDFTMGNDTPVWIDNPGNCTHTALVGIKEDEYSVTLVTKKVDW